MEAAKNSLQILKNELPTNSEKNCQHPTNPKKINRHPINPQKLFEMLGDEVTGEKNQKLWVA